MGVGGVELQVPGREALSLTVARELPNKISEGGSKVQVTHCPDD